MERRTDRDCIYESHLKQITEKADCVQQLQAVTKSEAVCNEGVWKGVIVP